MAHLFLLKIFLFYFIFFNAKVAKYFTWSLSVTYTLNYNLLQDTFENFVRYIFKVYSPLFPRRRLFTGFSTIQITLSDINVCIYMNIAWWKTFPWLDHIIKLSSIYVEYSTCYCYYTYCKKYMASIVIFSPSLYIRVYLIILVFFL